MLRQHSLSFEVARGFVQSVEMYIMRLGLRALPVKSAFTSPKRSREA